MSKHTPEPWRLVGGAALPYTQIIHGVVSVGKIAKNEDARRIVACVNACTGMSDPDKEIKALREVAEAQIAADDAIDAYEKDDDLDPEVLGAALRRRRQAIDAYRTLAALKAEGEVKNG